MILFFLLMISSAGTEELPTAASLLQPRDYHNYDVRQFLEETSAKPTKKGPVLFPNDGPPSPKTPLIVTARPLIESIARSELNNFTAETQLTQTYHPSQYLAGARDYQPYRYRSLDFLNVGNTYQGIEDGRNFVRTTVLPPIYRVFSDYANQNLKQYKPKPQQQSKKPVYTKKLISNHINDDDDYSTGENQNYAFSYKVRDQKTGDDFSHSQHSSGSATSGEYRVRLPDGRMQIVSYTADENGYKADVRYDDTTKTEQKYSNNKQYNYNVNNNFANDNQNIVVTPQPFDQFDALEDYSVKPIVEHNNDISKDDYVNPYSDSREYNYNEEAIDYEGKNYDYEPHKSKYSSFLGQQSNSNLGVIAIPTKTNEKLFTPTVRPSYEELKPLFVQRKVPLKPTVNYNGAAVEINSPSTTPRSGSESNDNERVVLIGTRPLYTNIKQNLPLSLPIYTTPRNAEPTIYTTPKNFVHPTNSPREYLFSTIASIRDKLNFPTARPVLSNKFLERINRYLKF